MMKKLTPLFQLLLLSFGLLAQPTAVRFQPVGAAAGLSQGFVHSLLKDQDGFLWIGTQDGLNRYDGYTFRHYFYDPADSTTLSNNYIWCLLEDRQGAIWVGTFGGGLCRYDRYTDRFETYFPKPELGQGNAKNSIRSLAESSAGIWVGTDDGLFLFDPQKKTFRAITPEVESADALRVFSIQEIGDEQFLVGSVGKVYHLSEPDGKLKDLRLPYAIDGGFHDFLPWGDSEFWAATGKGLLQFSFSAASRSLHFLQHFRPEAGKENSIASDYIAQLFCTADSVLWLATNSGIDYLDLRDKSEKNFQHFRHDTKNVHSLSSNVVLCLEEIEPGWLWAGTQEGINQFAYQTPVFNAFSLVEQGINCGVSIHGMSEDPQGNLWMATEKGILRAEKGRLETGSFTCYSTSDWPNLKDEFIVNLSAGKDSVLWVALRRGGFARLQTTDAGNPQLQGYLLPAGAYKNIGTNDLLEEEGGSLWIASSGLGLWRWHPQRDTFESFRANPADSSTLSGNYIFTLFKDSQNQLWIGTADGGLCRRNAADGSFSCFTHQRQDPFSLSNNMVLCIFEDSRQRIWVGTSNGLNLLENDGEFKRFLPKDGLPNAVIYSIQEDPEGQLWLSTNQGLAMLNFKAGVWEIQAFDVNDGLLANEFNQHAYYQLPDGRFLYGSKGGLTVFEPRNILPSTDVPEVVITDFNLFNESVPVAEKASPQVFSLEKVIQHTEELILPYRQNFLAFEFSAMQFVQAENCTYAYQMEGLDPDWVYPGTRRFASYPNLKPGDYVFKVKAANHDGIWNETPHTLKIRMLPPPWKTWWAYLLYALLIAGLIYSFIRFRLYHLQKIEKAKALEREQFRQRSARDFHDEAGNKITKISLMTEMAKRTVQDNPEVQQILGQVEENVQELRSGMRDFIWVLDPSNDSFYDTLLRLKDFANNIFEYSDIRFTTEGIHDDLKEISLQGNQRRHLLLLFKEAINNCLKYSQAKNATFSVQRSGDTIQMLFADDGIGFTEDQRAGHGLKNIATRAQKIGAKCQVETQRGEGTRISVNWRITQMGN